MIELISSIVSPIFISKCSNTIWTVKISKRNWKFSQLEFCIQQVLSQLSKVLLNILLGARLYHKMLPYCSACKKTCWINLKPRPLVKLIHNVLYHMKIFIIVTYELYIKSLTKHKWANFNFRHPERFKYFHFKLFKEPLSWGCYLSCNLWNGFGNAIAVRIRSPVIDWHMLSYDLLLIRRNLYRPRRRGIWTW